MLTVASLTQFDSGFGIGRRRRRRRKKTPLSLHSSVSLRVAPFAAELLAEGSGPVRVGFAIKISGCLRECVDGGMIYT